jgi:hypothetical protein
MAARIRKIRHDEDTRLKIKVATLINKLSEHIDGKIVMSPSQITAAKILLDKSLPNLSDLKLDTGAQGITFNLNVPKSSD